MIHPRQGFGDIHLGRRLGRGHLAYIDGVGIPGPFLIGTWAIQIAHPDNDFMKELVLEELSLDSTKIPDTIPDILLISLKSTFIHLTFVQRSKLDCTLTNIGAAHP